MKRYSPGSFCLRRCFELIVVAGFVGSLSSAHAQNSCGVHEVSPGTIDTRYAPSGFFSYDLTAQDRPAGNRFGPGANATTNLAVELTDGSTVFAGRGVLVGDAAGRDSVHLTKIFSETGEVSSQFGINGVAAVRIPLGADSDSVSLDTSALAVDPDEKLILGAQARLRVSGVPDRYFLLLARFNSDGSPDQTFGTAGFVITDLGSPQSNSSDAIAMLTPSKVIPVPNGIGGSFYIVTTPSRIYRFSAQGEHEALSPATTEVAADQLVNYAGNGLLFLRSLELTIDNLGRPLLTVSLFSLASRERGVGLIRLQNDWSLDSSFGSNGLQRIEPTLPLPQLEVRGVRTLRGGDILAFGYLADADQTRATHEDLAFIKFSPSGVLDASFGTNGASIIDIQDSGVSGTSQTIEAKDLVDGKFLVGVRHRAGQGGPLRVGLARLTTSGALDPTFGVDGFSALDSNVDDRWIHIGQLAHGEPYVGTTTTHGERRGRRLLAECTATFEISGTVLRNDQPFIRASLQISALGVVQTDTTGRFTFGRALRGSQIELISLPLLDMLAPEPLRFTLDRDFTALSRQYRTLHSVSGRVRLLASGMELAAASVTLTGVGEPISQAGGHYSFDGIPWDSRVSVAAELPGYDLEPGSYQLHVLLDAEANFDATLIVRNGDSCVQGLEQDCIDEELRASACVGANGFLDQINIATIINRLSVPLPIVVQYRDLAGVERGSVNATLAANSKRDFIINDLGLVRDTYGTVCVRSSIPSRGAWSGTMIVYKPDTRRGPVPFGERFDFVLNYPFQNPRTGAGTVQLNTFHLGMPESNPVANWISIADANSEDGEPLQGDLIYLNEQGNEIVRERLEIPNGGRQDFAGHRIAVPPVVNAVGMARFEPVAALSGRDAEYYLTLVRYYYDSPTPAVPNFLTAFEVPDRPSTEQSLAGDAILSGGLLGVLELANTGDVAIRNDVTILDRAGTELGNNSVEVPALGTRHVIINNIGGNGPLAADIFGSAVVNGARSRAVAFFYKLNAAGGLEYAYASPLQSTPLLGVQVSQFNSFIDHENVAVITNTTSQPLSLSIEAFNFDGRRLSASAVTIPARGTTVSPLALPADGYGTVLMQSGSGGFISKVYTSRANEYSLVFRGQ